MDYTELRYWLQEQAPNGRWVDRLGLGKSCSREQAVEELNAWRQGERHLKYRMILRIDVPFE